MRPYARLRGGRIFALAMRVWLRRLLQIHAVALLCLAPLAIVPELLGARSAASLFDEPLEDGRFLGLFGLYTTAWAVAFDFLAPHEGFLRNLTVFYLGQFAVSMLIVRDAHRHLSGRAPRCGPFAALGLALLALGGLALFVALDSVTAAASEGEPALALLFAIATTIADLYIAGAAWLALPAAAVDGRGVLPALGRSRLLTEGSRFSVASLIVLLTVLQWVALFPLGVLVDTLNLGRHLGWLVFVPVILFLTLKACVLAAAYHEAAFRKEGAGAAEVSKVFA